MQLFRLFSWSIDLFAFYTTRQTNTKEKRINWKYIFFLFNRGLVPAVAEMRYLDRVKWLDLYGVDLHPVLVSSFYLYNNILPIPGCQNVNFQKTRETDIVSVCLFVCLVSGTWIFFFFLSWLVGLGCLAAKRWEPEKNTHKVNSRFLFRFFNCTRVVTGCPPPAGRIFHSPNLSLPAKSILLLQLSNIVSSWCFPKVSQTVCDIDTIVLVTTENIAQLTNWEKRAGRRPAWGIDGGRLVYALSLSRPFWFFVVWDLPFF